MDIPEMHDIVFGLGWTFGLLNENSLTAESEESFSTYCVVA